MKIRETVTLVVLASVLACGSANAQGIKKWRTPSGSIYLGDKPPQGSVEVGEYPDEPRSSEGAGGATEQSNADKFSVQISLRRHEIERKINLEAARLEQIRSDIAEAKKKPVVVTQRLYNLETDENGKNRLVSPMGVEQEKLQKLEQTERQQLAEIKRLRNDFAALSREVKEHFGSVTPPWWRDSLSCPKCPAT